MVVIINISSWSLVAQPGFWLKRNLGFELFLLWRSLGRRRGATDWFRPFTWEQIGIDIITSQLLGSVEGLGSLAGWSKSTIMYLCSLNSRSLWRWRRSTRHSLTDHPEKGPKIILKGGPTCSTILNFFQWRHFRNTFLLFHLLWVFTFSLYIIWVPFSLNVGDSSLWVKTHLMLEATHDWQ